MIRFDLVAVGERVGRYRRAAGISAQDLADRAGSGLTRSIVANLEAGRRADVGVAQLYAMAWVLQIPPSVLVFDIERPSIEIGVGEQVTNAEALSWSLGRNRQQGPLNDVWLVVTTLEAYRQAQESAADIGNAINDLRREQPADAEQLGRLQLFHQSALAQVANFEHLLRAQGVQL